MADESYTEMPTDADTPLSAELMGFRAAQEQEFTDSRTKTSDDLAETARAELFEMLPNAKTELRGIMLNGDKDDTVRLNAIKLVFAYTLGDPKTASKESDIEKLIKQLQEKPEGATS